MLADASVEFFSSLLRRLSVARRWPERDLVSKVKYYLGHEEERLEMAEAARVRCWGEHSMERRMGEMVGRMQLVCRP